MQTTAAEVVSYEERIKVAAEAAAAENARKAAKALVEVQNEDELRVEAKHFEYTFHALKVIPNSDRHSLE